MFTSCRGRQGRQELPVHQGRQELPVRQERRGPLEHRVLPACLQQLEDPPRIQGTQYRKRRN